MYRFRVSYTTARMGLILGLAGFLSVNLYCCRVKYCHGHSAGTHRKASRIACRGYKYRRNRLIILLVLADYHTLADLHHPRWDLDSGQGPDAKPNDREEDQKGDQEPGNDGCREDLDSR